MQVGLRPDTGGWLGWCLTLCSRGYKKILKSSKRKGAAYHHYWFPWRRGKIAEDDIDEIVTPDALKRPEPVVINVYDMGGDDVAKTVNEAFRPLGMGAFHGAVEVYGREWSFGWTAEGTGVFSCRPKGSTQHRYRETVALGETHLNRREVAQLLRQLEWPGIEYDMLRRNCINWCDEFVTRLGAEPIPTWVNKVATEVAKIDDGVQGAVHNVQEAVQRVQHHVTIARQNTAAINEKIRDTVEAEAEKLREQAEATWKRFDEQLKLSVATVTSDWNKLSMSVTRGAQSLPTSPTLTSRICFQPSMDKHQKHDQEEVDFRSIDLTAPLAPISSPVSVSSSRTSILHQRSL